MTKSILTKEQWKANLWNEIESHTGENDGSLTAQVVENATWAWDNWGPDILKDYHVSGEIPEEMPEDFLKEWFDLEDFDSEYLEYSEGPDDEE